MMNTINLILMAGIFSMFLLMGCREPEDKNIEKTTSQKQSVIPILKLPPDAVGIFTGEEPAYSMRVGDKIIPMSSSKWRLEISNTLLEMQQVSDGQTIHYSGKYNIEFDDEIKTIINAQLIEDKYNQDFTPTLRYNKATKSWFLEGVMGSEGCTLNKE